MKRKKIKFINILCRRGCGTELITANKAIHGAEKLRQKYFGICEDCITPEEKYEILSGIGDSILQAAQK